MVSDFESVFEGGDHCVCAYENLQIVFGSVDEGF